MYRVCVLINGHFLLDDEDEYCGVLVYLMSMSCTTSCSVVKSVIWHDNYGVITTTALHSANPGFVKNFLVVKIH